jgi:hypothetical protein
VLEENFWNVCFPSSSHIYGELSVSTKKTKQCLKTKHTLSFFKELTVHQGRHTSPRWDYSCLYLELCFRIKARFPMDSKMCISLWDGCWLNHRNAWCPQAANYFSMFHMQNADHCNALYWARYFSHLCILVLLLQKLEDSWILKVVNCKSTFLPMYKWIIKKSIQEHVFSNRVPLPSHIRITKKNFFWGSVDMQHPGLCQLPTKLGSLEF